MGVRRDIDDAASPAHRFGDESAVGGTFPAVERRRIDRATIERVYVKCLYCDDMHASQRWVRWKWFHPPVVKRTIGNNRRIVDHLPAVETRHFGQTAN
jgi:hypothetical protein